MHTCIMSVYEELKRTLFYQMNFGLMYLPLQMDLKFWCSWDDQTMEINVVDVNEEKGSEVIHWVYKFPVSIP